MEGVGEYVSVKCAKKKKKFFSEQVNVKGGIPALVRSRQTTSLTHWQLLLSVGLSVETQRLMKRSNTRSSSALH